MTNTAPLLCEAIKGPSGASLLLQVTCSFITEKAPIGHFTSTPTSPVSGPVLTGPARGPDLGRGAVVDPCCIVVCDGVSQLLLCEFSSQIPEGRGLNSEAVLTRQRQQRQQQQSSSSSSSSSSRSLFVLTLSLIRPKYMTVSVYPGDTSLLSVSPPRLAPLFSSDSSFQGEVSLLRIKGPRQTEASGS
ncbi:uncharacterized protein V6R79_024918 [Siganus canaliculatus]